MVQILEDRSRFCGLLPLQEHHLSRVFLSGAAHIDSFRADGGRYINLIEPEGGVEVCFNALVVPRVERDQFERAHGLVQPAGAAVAENRDPQGPWANLRNDGVIDGGLSNPLPLADSPVDCGEDGGWLRVHGRAYVFTGSYQKAIVRRLHEAWLMGVPHFRTQMLLEDIGCRSKQITHVFSGADPRWREIIGYGQGYVWLKRPR